MSDIRHIVDELRYRSYVAQRVQAPAVDPGRWQTIFGPEQVLFEQRYQQEQVGPSALDARAEELAREALSQINSFLPKNQDQRAVTAIKRVMLQFAGERLAAVAQDQAGA
jgi:hypothetical protein